MKKLLDRIRERFAQPKWRHGKLGALLMAVFLAACVLFNIAAASLEDAYGWRRDLSFNSYATTGEETQKYLDTLTSDVELYLLYQSGAQEVLYQQIAQVLNRYKALCDRVKVLPTDVAKNHRRRFRGGVLPRHGALQGACLRGFSDAGLQCGAGRV